MKRHGRHSGVPLVNGGASGTATSFMLSRGCNGCGGGHCSQAHSFVQSEAASKQCVKSSSALNNSIASLILRIVHQVPFRHQFLSPTSPLSHRQRHIRHDPLRSPSDSTMPAIANNTTSFDQSIMQFLFLLLCTAPHVLAKGRGGGGRPGGGNNSHHNAADSFSPNQSLIVGATVAWLLFFAYRHVAH